MSTKETYSNRISIQIGKVLSDVKASNYFPKIGEEVTLTALNKWAQTCQWKTTTDGETIVTTDGVLDKLKSEYKLTPTVAGDLLLNFIGTNYVSNKNILKHIYSIGDLITPYFDLSVSKEVCRIGDTSRIYISTLYNYNRTYSAVINIYKEYTDTPEWSFDSSIIVDGNNRYYDFSTTDITKRGIYDIEVVLTDIESGVSITKKIEKLITLTPKLCPKPLDTTTGFENIYTYSSYTTYSPNFKINFHIKLWRNVNSSGLNYAEAILPSNLYDKLDLSVLPAGTTLVIKKDPALNSDYSFRFLANGGVSADVSSDNGTPNATFESPLIITHDDEDIFRWGWNSYGFINLNNNIRNIVFDGYGYNNTSIYNYIFDKDSLASTSVFLVGGTSDIEFFGYDIDGSGFACIVAKSEPNPNQPWYWRSSGWTMDNTLLHHCKLENSEGENIYFGYFATGDLSGTNSSGSVVTYRAHILKRVEIYRNEFANSGFDSIQINNGIEVDVCYNDIHGSGQSHSSGQGYAFSCVFDGKCHNNYVHDIEGPAFYLIPFLTGVDVYNNIVIAAKNAVCFIAAMWSALSSWWFDKDGDKSNDLYFHCFNNLFKSKTTFSINTDFLCPFYTFNDNVVITEVGETSLRDLFTGTGNYFLKGDDEYSNIDNILKCADSANNNYQPYFSSPLITFGDNSLTDFDYRGYKRWYNIHEHCGPFLGIIKDTNLPDIDFYLLNIIINNGQSVYTQDISVKFNYSGTPTKYKLSETSDLSGVAWTDWVSDTVDFLLSSGFGSKTLYAQIANDTITSLIISTTIDYQVLPVTLNSVTISGGSNLTVNISYNYSGTYGLSRIRIGEQSDLSDAAWLTYSQDTLVYNFTTAGTKSLYMLLEDTEGNTSEIVLSNELEVTTLIDKIVLGFNNTSYNNLATVSANSDTINQIKFAINSTYSQHSLYTVDNRLLNNWKVNLNSSYYVSNEVFTGNEYAVARTNCQSIADDSGIYPVSVFLQCVQCKADISNTKSRLSMSLPAGNYKIKFLYSVGTAYQISSETDRLKMHYGVYKGTTQLNSCIVGYENFTSVGNSNYNNELTFSVDVDGIIDIAMWYEDTHNYWYLRPGYNLLEITKL